MIDKDTRASTFYKFIKNNFDKAGINLPDVLIIRLSV
jgi:hypothetical protein